MYIGDWLARREMLSPESVALVDAQRDYRTITYREWNRSANRTANWLSLLGVRMGDLVAILSLNCVEYLDLWFACGKLGAIMQTLNCRLTTRELGALLKEATPRVLVYGAEFALHAQELRAEVPNIEHLAALDLASAATPEDRLFSERDRCPDAPPPPVELTLDTPWALCYTGGTTGLPKGAILTHGNVTWNSVNTVMSWGLTSDDRTILNMPLFHTGGLNVLTAPLVHMGGTSVVCKGFDVEQVFDLVESHGVTVYFGVPTMFVAQQVHPRWESADFSGLKWVVTGGAPCPMPIFERFWARGVDFKMGYGMTECGPNTFWLPSADTKRKLNSVGVPLFHVDVKVVVPGGRECGPDEAGELLIRGPHVVPGYWNRPEDSAHAIVDGWLHTGDLARYDSEGYFYIVGRLKEMIISGGENVYPAEVEAVMSEHPDVETVAVIGVPDAHWGEVGMAIVVAKTGKDLDAIELLDFCRSRLARYKVPKHVVFAPELPITGAGKIDKKALRELYAGTTDESSLRSSIDDRR